MSKMTWQARVWTLAGMTCLMLAVIGAVLPVMPTTVFILMAAGCFAKGHPAWEQRLLSHATFGTTLRDWRMYHGMRSSAKVAANLGMAVSFGVSLWLCRSDARLQALLLLVWASLAVWIWHLPTISKTSRQSLPSHCTLRNGRHSLKDQSDGIR